MNTDEKLQKIFQELKFKVPSSSVPEAIKPALVDLFSKETAARHTYRIQRLLSLCGIPKAQIRTFDDFDWSFNPKTPKQDLLNFRTSNWIEEHMNLVLIGDPGIGKSHLAKSLCYDAIRKGHSACFLTAFDLLSKLKKARFVDSKINFYAKSIRVLCIDELGYVYHDKNDTDLLYHVISLRCESQPTLVTSNLEPKEWGKILPGSAASAILDRLSFNGTFLSWDGPSYRIKTRRK